MNVERALDPTSNARDTLVMRRSPVIMDPTRRAINVPLSLVTDGPSRSLPAKPPPSSATISRTTTAICKEGVVGCVGDPGSVSSRQTILAARHLGRVPAPLIRTSMPLSPDLKRTAAFNERSVASSTSATGRLATRSS